MNKLVFKGCDDDWIASGLGGIEYHYYGLGLEPTLFYIVFPDKSILKARDYDNNESKNLAQKHHDLMCKIQDAAYGRNL